MSVALASLKASRAKKCPEKFYTCSISYKNPNFEIWNQLDHKYRSWRLFFWGGVCLRPTDPLDPLERVLGGHLLENFPRGGVSPNFKSQGGGQTP